MTVDIATLGIRIDSSDARTAARDMEQFRGAGARAEQQVSALDAVSRKAAQALQLLGVGAGVGAIIRMADEYAKFNAQIKLATQSQREYSAAVDDVRRIANAAQQDLAATGTLYARITNGTRELGVQQKQVAAITETINLALKVSGATAAESASAQLQLSQAFASGTLRGEEFNAVNEAAPRLMKALADGMGVPIGALKDMASNGEITSKIMATVLPQALEQLREESKQVQTIAGAFTVLKNNVLEFTGTQAQANGTVSLLTGGIMLLANNLNVLMGVVTTVTAVKMANSFTEWATGAYQSAAANRALTASNLATAQTNVAATAAALATAQAREAELRASVLAAEGVVALAIAENGLIPAQVRSAAAAQAHTAALAAQTTAAGAASIGMGVLRGALAFLGGPIGAVVTVLGVAATAWSWYSSKSAEANAKTTEETKASTAEVVAQMTKQIEVMERRNKMALAGAPTTGKQNPLDDKLAEIVAQIDQVGKAKGDYAKLSYEARGEVLKVLGGQYAEVTALIERFNKASADGAGNTTAAKALIEIRERLSGVSNQYQKDLKTYQTALAEGVIGMEEYTRGLTALAQETWKASDAGKVSAATSKAMVDARLEAIKSGIAREKNIREEGIARVNELNRQGAASDAEVFNAKYAAALAAGKDAAAVFDAEIAALVAYNGKDAAERIANNAKIKDLGAQRTEALRASAAAAAQLRLAYDYDKDKPARDAVAATQKEVVAINDQIDATQRQIAAYNKLPSAVTEATIAQMEGEKAVVGMFEGSEAAVAAIEAKIQAYKRLAAEQKTLEGLGTGTDVAKAEQLLKILQAIDGAARQAAQGMADSFGRVGAAIGGLTTALTGYAVQQQAIAAQLAAVKADPKSDAQKIAQAEMAASKASAQAQIKSYGDMAGAAKGFFNENSKGYKVLEATEKAYRAVEMAMAVESMARQVFAVGAVTTATVAGEATKSAAINAGTAVQVASDMVKGTSAAAVAVATQAQGDPYTAWARMAAMAAAMAALGFAVFGGGGGGGGMSAADVQKIQGTGSVFGDSTAKSDSIRRSIEGLKANSDNMLPINQGMLTALQNIESAMTGLTNLVVRTTGLTDGGNFDVATGQINKGAPTDAISSVLSKVTDGLLGNIVGGKVASILNNVWGKTTQNIVDAGLQYGGSVRGLQAGQGFEQYASIDTTKSSWFGLSKKTSNRVEVQGLNDELSAQFGQIFTNLDKSLQAAAAAMGGSAADVTKVLDNLSLASTKVSLKGLTGTALTDALNAVISKSMDDIAQAAFPQLDKFRQVGEGYAETVMRIAGDYAKLDAILAGSGTTFGATGVASVAARERLIELAGGIDKLAGQANAFNTNFLTQAEQLAPVQKYVNEQLAAMGLQSLDTRDKFKDYVLGLANSGALATEAGAQQYTALLALAEAFAKTHAATVDLSKSEQEIADERKDLQSRYDAATMTEAQLADKARDAIDEHNRTLYDEVLAAEAAKAVATERKDLQTRLDAATLSSAQLAEKARNAIDSHNLALYDQTLAAEAAKSAAEKLASTNSSYQNQIDDMLKASMSATQVRALETKGMDASTLALYDRLAALKAEQTAQAALTTAQNTLLSAYNKQKSALQSVVDLQTKAAEATQKQIDALKLGDLSDLSPEQKYLEAQRQFDKAAAGDEKNAAAQALLQASRAYNGSTGAYATDYAKVQAALVTQVASQRSAASIAQQQLSALDQQVGQLIDINSGVDALNGSMKDLQQAIVGLGTSMLALAAANAAAGKPDTGDLSGKGMQAIDQVLTGIYKSELGRAPDAAGLAYWEDRMKNGSTYDEVVSDFHKSDEYKALHPTPHAMGGIASGWSLVGEEGPELVHFGQPGRVYTASQTKAALGGPDASPEVAQLLREVIAELRADKAQRGAVGVQTLKKLDTLAADNAKLKRELARA